MRAETGEVMADAPIRAVIFDFGGVFTTSPIEKGPVFPIRCATKQKTGALRK